MKLKRYIAYLNSMDEWAFAVLAGTLKTCCAMAFCAFMLLTHIGELSVRNFEVYLLALELTLSPAAILLVGGLVSVILEDMRRQ